MLELIQVKKDYPAGSGTVHALKGIDLKFRKSEFVSILGPSGCGKTTMLNIIGGLDQYTAGDLIINGVSTKNYKDRDWDTYRNHTIGFVFQSYNLIPHQTVLQNVELALTLSGVSKAERRKRAKEALEAVGLGDQLSKKPSQLSGGQMQRVAIARALVNNPDIILADEPTGALDTETSVQVMEILKEVAKDRLVIMVTHNPDLAETYSTRIIRMLDGVIIDDSMPLAEQEVAEVPQEVPVVVKKKREKKPSMRLTTAFSLSLKNLISKKGRTLLTSFAGSIGIIGIALIFAVSQGMTTYINSVQEDTLSSYPLTLQAKHLNMGSLLTAFMDQASSHEAHENDAIYQKPMLYDLVNAFNAMDSKENDLKAFKAYLEEKLADKNGELYNAVSGVQYSYNLDMLVYTKDADGKIIRSDAQTLLQKLMIKHLDFDMSSMMNMGEQYGVDSSMMSMGTTTTWQEILPGKDGEMINPLLKKQYDIIDGGRWPEAYNEIVLVVDKNNEIDDMTLYALGLKTADEMDELAQAGISKDSVTLNQQKWTYDEIKAREYKVILNFDCFKLDPGTGLYVDLMNEENQTSMKYLYDNALPLKVVGIVRPSEEAASGMLTGAIGYTSALTEHIVKQAGSAASVQAQMKDTTKDIFTGLPFKENTENLSQQKKAELFAARINSLDEAGKAKAFTTISCLMPEADLKAQVEQLLAATSVEEMRETLKNMAQQQMGTGSTDIEKYLASMSDEDVRKWYGEMLPEMIKMQYAQQVMMRLKDIPAQQLAQMLDAKMSAENPEGYTEEMMAKYYDEVLEFSESTYKQNLEKLGHVDLDDPASINLFAVSFESKEVIEAAIADYNSTVDELEKIEYTDYVGLMMSSITTIIDAITYVLISFVAISLVVSSIMIGVITLISVQERTKEIGILRSVGASKRNVSSMFNAETVIIGFAAGAIGVGFTWLVCIPINAILYALTGIAGLKAYLPIPVAVVLVLISVLLTMFAGIIPARSAAKKDPVVALRTE